MFDVVGFQTNLFLQFCSLSQSIEESQAQIQDAWVKIFLDEHAKAVQKSWILLQGIDKAQTCDDWLRLCGYGPERGLQSVEISRDKSGEEHPVLFINFGR